MARAYSAWALATCGDDDAAAFLRSATMAGRHPFFAMFGWVGLGLRGDPGAFADMEAGFVSPNKLMRYAAAWGLSVFKGPKAAECLSARISLEKQDEVRALLFRGLGGMVSSPSPDALSAIARDIPGTAKAALPALQRILAGR